MPKQYIIANIKIPIEILENGSTNPFMERCAIELEKCEILPPENKNNNSLFIEKLTEFINKNTNHNQNNKPENTPTNDIISNLFVNKDEIKSRSKTRSLVTTFKNYPTKKINRFTVKNKSKNEMDVDSIEYKEVQG